MVDDTRAYAFAGGGVAGLTLAAAIAAAEPERRLILVDEHGFAGPPRFDRSIGFWSAGEPPFAELLDASWSQLEVAGPRGPHTLELGPLRYHALRWSRLRAALLDALRARPRVELRHARVAALASVAGSEPGVALTLESGESIAAALAFDSRLELDSLAAAPGRLLGWQRFWGLEIEVDEPRFDPSRATFMDLRASTPERVAFLNVLPRSPRRALVYHVEFSPTRAGPSLRPALVDDLARQFHVERFEVHGEERGALPVSDQAWQRRPGPAILRIGNAGGRLKPSSAYAFTRILADNEAILASFRSHGHPFALPRERARFRWLDGTLIDLLLRRPALGPVVFETLFRRARTSTVFALLDERASPAELVEIMLAMPHKRALAWAGLRRLLAWTRAPRRALAASQAPARLPPG